MHTDYVGLGPYFLVLWCSGFLTHSINNIRSFLFPYHLEVLHSWSTFTICSFDNLWAFQSFYFLISLFSWSMFSDLSRLTSYSFYPAIISQASLSFLYSLNSYSDDWETLPQILPTSSWVSELIQTSKPKTRKDSLLFSPFLSHTRSTSCLIRLRYKQIILALSRWMPMRKLSTDPLL